MWKKTRHKSEDKRKRHKHPKYKHPQIKNAETTSDSHPPPTPRGPRTPTRRGPRTAPRSLRFEPQSLTPPPAKTLPFGITVDNIMHSAARHPNIADTASDGIAFIRDSSASRAGFRIS